MSNQRRNRGNNRGNNAFDRNASVQPSSGPSSMKIIAILKAIIYELLPIYITLSELKKNISSTTKSMYTLAFFFYRLMYHTLRLLVSIMSTLSIKTYVKIVGWFTIWAFFIYADFGSLWIIISMFLLLFANLGKKKSPNEISAYSVFNKGFQNILGTINIETFENELRHRQPNQTHDDMTEAERAEEERWLREIEEEEMLGDYEYITEEEDDTDDENANNDSNLSQTDKASRRKEKQEEKKKAAQAAKKKAEEVFYVTQKNMEDRLSSFYETASKKHRIITNILKSREIGLKEKILDFADQSAEGSRILNSPESFQNINKTSPNDSLNSNDLIFRTIYFHQELLRS